MKKIILILSFIFIELNASSLSSDGGRYVFGQISEYRKDQYLLDTATGRVWQTVLNENNTTVFQPIFFTRSTLYRDSYDILPSDTKEARAIQSWIESQRSNVIKAPQEELEAPLINLPIENKQKTNKQKKK